MVRNIWPLILSICHNSFFQCSLSLFAGWAIAAWGLNVENRSREIDLLRAYELDLDANQQRISDNIEYAADEIELLKRNQLTLDPMQPLAVEGWRLVRTSVPDLILGDPQLLPDILRTQERVESFNELVESRETYKILNQPLRGLLKRSLSTTVRSLSECKI